MGSAPDLDWVLDCCPVDYAADAIVGLTRLRSDSLRAFHLVNPTTRHWREIVLWMNLFGYPIKLDPFRDWLARLKHRDLRVFVIFCGGLIGYPFHAMVAVGFLTHVLILGILFKGWGLPHARPGQVAAAASTDVRPTTAAPLAIEAPSQSV